MTDDATLSDFEAVSDDPDERPPGDRAAEGGGADSDRADGKAGTPSTYAWGEYTCSRCSAETDRVWRDGDAFVCPGCKSW